MKNEKSKTKAAKLKTSKPSFVEKNTIWPQADGSKTKGNLDMSMFSENALGSKMVADGQYASKNKGMVEACGYKKDNMIAPDANY